MILINEQSSFLLFLKRKRLTAEKRSMKKLEIVLPGQSGWSVQNIIENEATKIMVSVIISFQWSAPPTVSVTTRAQAGRTQRKEAKLKSTPSGVSH